MVVQFATKVESLLAREYPFRHRLRRCHLPQGDGNPLRLTAFASSPEGGALLVRTGRCLKAPPSGELARRQA